MENYRLSPIKNFKDALEVRKIRNQCRLFMTNFISEIGYREQFNWYYKTYRKENKKMKMFCFLFYVNNDAVGFGFVRESKNKFWITGGLKENQRGKGYGKLLFKEIVNSVPAKEVWLEVLASNTAAKKIYNELGFKNIKGLKINNKEVICMSLEKKSDGTI